MHDGTNKTLGRSETASPTSLLVSPSHNCAMCGICACLVLATMPALQIEQHVYMLDRSTATCNLRERCQKKEGVTSDSGN